MEAIRFLAHDFITGAKITKLPLTLEDLLTICRRLNYNPLSYSEARDLIKEHHLEKYLHLNAFTYCYRDLRVILYNDAIGYSDKIFAVAHEMSHNILGHAHAGPDSHMAAAIQEAEANIFTYELLAPICVLKRCHVTTVKQLKAITFLNDNYVPHILADMESYRQPAQDAALLEQFREFITSYNKQRLQAIHTNIIRGVTLALGIAIALYLSSPWRSPQPTAAPSAIVSAIPAPSPTPAVIPEEQRVLITASGSKYHRPDCYHITDSPAIEIPISEATSAGYEPCKTCRP